MFDQTELTFIAVFIVSLCIGSFLNVVIYRLPVMMKRQWRTECETYLAQNPNQDYPPKDQAFNLYKPNSTCPKCQHKIRAWENIPVISYLFLRGKCSQCKSPISLRYPLVEFTTALLSLLPLLIWGPSIQAYCAIGLTWVLVALTMIDIDEQLLPDSMTLPLLWVGLIINSFGVYCSLNDALWGAAAGYMSLWSVYWSFKLLTGKDGMGFGDFKLLAALGAWMGWQALPLIILGSSLVGAIIGIAMMMFQGKNRQLQIPFGPYLAIAGLITFYWSEPITQAYFKLVM